MTRLAAFMADYTNQHHCEFTFAVDSYAWLSTYHLKLPVTLSWKLASRYIGPFNTIEKIYPIFYYLIVGRCMMHFMHHS